MSFIRYCHNYATITRSYFHTKNLSLRGNKVFIIPKIFIKEIYWVDICFSVELDNSWIITVVNNNGSWKSFANKKNHVTLYLICGWLRIQVVSKWGQPIQSPSNRGLVGKIKTIGVRWKLLRKNLLNVWISYIWSLYKDIC